MSVIESEPILIASYSISGVKEAVNTRRLVKHAAADLSLAGRRGASLESVLDRVELVTSRMEYAQLHWVEGKIKLLESYFTKGNQADGEDNGSFGNSWLAAVREGYFDGFATTVTQEYRFLKKERGGLDKLEDTDYIQNFVLGYSFDFFRTLRVCERLGVNPKAAIEVAKLAYHFDPNQLIELSAKYPAMDAYIIKSAAVGYPSDPEGFLKRVETKSSVE